MITRKTRTASFHSTIISQPPDNLLVPMTQSKTRFIIFNKNTIFEPDFSEERRPKKRARVEDEESDGLSGLFRDSQYYDSRSSDACVILAGDTLFRVRFLLCLILVLVSYYDIRSR